MLILLAGRIATGKSAVAAELSDQAGLTVVSARQALLHMTAAPATRSGLQRAGVELDRRTAGRWLLEYLREQLEGGSVVVDSVRTVRQTEPVLADETSSRLIYLTAHDETRRKRYAMAAATDPVKRGTPFDRAENHPTERRVSELRALAHVVVETDSSTPALLATEVLHHIESL